jgi:hypothetical protein
MFSDKTLHRLGFETQHAETVSDYSERVVSFIQMFCFSINAATVITGHWPSLTEFQSLTNAPQEFLEDFHDMDKAALDPVSQHCKHRSSPIVWGRTLTTPRSSEISGITKPLLDTGQALRWQCTSPNPPIIYSAPAVTSSRQNKARAPSRASKHAELRAICPSGCVSTLR